MGDLEELPRLLIELRGLIREGHGVVSDLRAAIREAKYTSDTLPEVVDSRLGKEVARGLQVYGETLDRALADATQAMYDRFDILTAICLGEDPESVRKGNRSIVDLLRLYVETKGLPIEIQAIEKQQVPEAFKRPDS